MKTVNISVFGRVQGVFFRKSTKEKAEELGVYGWVRNDRDGSVEIMATGDKKVLEKLVSWCKKGSPMSRVDSTEVDWLEDEEDFTAFDII